MNKWKEPGDGEYTRRLDDGSVVKVFEQMPFWRAVIDDRMVDNIFFEALDAIQAIDKWEAGHGELTLHPIERRWLGDDRKGYTRPSQRGELKVTQSSCGNWRINLVPERCFGYPSSACKHADERLP